MADGRDISFFGRYLSVWVALCMAAFLRGAFARLIPPGLAAQYLAGAVLLGVASCTAMVFVRSAPVRGNAAYMVVQVATNDLIILLAFAPTVKFLLGVGDVSVPYSTLFASVALFVVILANPLHILLIAVPLVAQTFLIFALAYGAGRLLRLPHDIAAPAGMIGASNFFELAVAVAAALATTVGVLMEVPVMLALVRLANWTRW